MEKFIYLISNNNEAYKIGISKNDPVKRLKTLQTGSLEKLELVYFFKSKYANILEKTLHRIFELEHSRGEWFHLSKSQVCDFLRLCAETEDRFNILETEDNIFFKKMMKY